MKPAMWSHTGGDHFTKWEVTGGVNFDTIACGIKFQNPHLRADTLIFTCKNCNCFY